MHTFFFFVPSHNYYGVPLGKDETAG